jgi:hypothetical protein
MEQTHQEQIKKQLHETYCTKCGHPDWAHFKPFIVKGNRIDISKLWKCSHPNCTCTGDNLICK